MPKTIEQLSSGLTVGHVGLGHHGSAIGTVRQEVHDGDTINVRAVGDFGIRFLGIDAPEISFTLPGSRTFTSLGDPRWEAFFANWDDEAAHGAFNPPLQVALHDHLQMRIVAGVAQNHDRHSRAAQAALEDEVSGDMQVLGQNVETFQFFLAFAFEIMDRYGRMLCYVNREQPDPNVPERRPLYYNERLLGTGRVLPYFIWPNVDPFIKQASLFDAVIEPGEANRLDAPRLQASRGSVREARQEQRGVFETPDPLILEAFEVRFLAQRRAPNRWVIDLSKADDVLIQPQNYFTVPNAEDRLFIPEEYIPLFLNRGWRLQQ